MKSFPSCTAALFLALVPIASSSPIAGGSCGHDGQSSNLAAFVALGSEGCYMDPVSWIRIYDVSASVTPGFPGVELPDLSAIQFAVSSLISGSSASAFAFIGYPGAPIGADVSLSIDAPGHVQGSWFARIDLVHHFTFEDSTTITMHSWNLENNLGFEIDLLGGPPPTDSAPSLSLISAPEPLATPEPGALLPLLGVGLLCLASKKRKPNDSAQTK